MKREERGFWVFQNDEIVRLKVQRCEKRVYLEFYREWRLIEIYIERGKGVRVEEVSIIKGFVKEFGFFCVFQDDF